MIRPFCLFLSPRNSFPSLSSSSLQSPTSSPKTKESIEEKTHLKTLKKRRKVIKYIDRSYIFVKISLSTSALPCQDRNSRWAKKRFNGLDVATLLSLLDLYIHGARHLTTRFTQIDKLPSTYYLFLSTPHTCFYQDWEPRLPSTEILLNVPSTLVGALLAPARHDTTLPQGAPHSSTLWEAGFLSPFSSQCGFLYYDNLRPNGHLSLNPNGLYVGIIYDPVDIVLAAVAAPTHDYDLWYLPLFAYY